MVCDCFCRLLEAAARLTMSQYEGIGLPAAANLLSRHAVSLAALGCNRAWHSQVRGKGGKKAPLMLKNTKSLSKKWTDTHPSEVLKIVQSRDRYYVISHYPFPLLPFLYPCTDLSLWISGGKSIVHINPCVETWGSEGGGVRVDPGPTNSTST